ncbi:MAG: CHAT domain-containing protein [Thermoanaerobaculia bacterium]
MKIQRPLLGILFGAATVAAFCLWVAVRAPPWKPWSGYFGGGTSPLDLLQGALGGRRPLPARLDGVSYAPYSVRRGDSPGDTEPETWQAVQRSIRRSEELGHATTAAVARAVVELMLGRDGQAVDEAIETLEFSREKDASSLSDLTALYFARAVELRRPHDILPALERVSEAIELDPRNAAARFNLALLLEHLTLENPASATWDEYLVLDSESSWAAEARSRRQRLTQRTGLPRSARRDELAELAGEGQREALLSAVASSRGEAYFLLESELLPRLHETLSANPAGSRDFDTELLRATVLAAALEEITGDGFLRRTVEQLGRQGPGSTTDLASLDAGFGRFLEARAAFSRQDLASARRGFAEAAAHLRAAASPWELKALFFAALCDSNRQRYDKARRVFEEAAERAEAAGFSDIEGDARWMIGLGWLAGGYPEQALRAYQKMLTAYDRAGDPEKRAGALNLIAETHDFLGEHEAAWARRLEGLHLVGPQVNPRLRFQLFFTSAASALAAGYPRAALRFQDEAVRRAAELDEPTTAADTLLGRSRIHHLTGASESARQDLEAARGWLSRVPDAGAAGLTRAVLATVEAETRLADDPEAVVRSLSEAIDFYRAEHRFPLAATLLARARAHLALADEVNAGRDLDDCVAAYEAIRSEIHSWRQRVTFFDRAMAAFDELIRLRFDQGLTEKAFEAAEKRRSRALLDALESARRKAGAVVPEVGVPLPLAQIRNRLEPGVTLLEYVFAGDRVAVWVVSRDGFHGELLTTDQQELTRRIGEFREKLALGDRAAAEIRQLGEDLYRRLLEPLAGRLQERLVVIAEGPLLGVPFAALVNPATGRFVLEERVVTSSPSASLHVLDRADGTRNAELDLLAFGDPAIDRGWFAQPRLPRAEAEARRVAGLYRKSMLLVGSEATEERFLELAPQASVLHFGGHAEAHPRQPGRSRMLFASSTGNPDGGALHAHELQSLRLPRTRLAVLGACSTAVGPVSRGEGLLSLAYAFMVAGVPAVVASRWDVDDRVSEALLIRFHEGFTAGATAAEALRSAQLALLAGDRSAWRSPAAWAAFQLYGDAEMSDQPGEGE